MSFCEHAPVLSLLKCVKSKKDEVQPANHRDLHDCQLVAVPVIAALQNPAVWNAVCGVVGDGDGKPGFAGAGWWEVSTWRETICYIQWHNFNDIQG